MNSNLPNERCEAAHPDDTSPCTGPTDAVYVVDTTGATAPGCIHHAAALLASVADARVIPGSLTGAAIEAYDLARQRRPFDFLSPAGTAGRPRPEVGGDQGTAAAVVTRHATTVFGLYGTGYQVSAVPETRHVQIVVRHGEVAIGDVLTVDQVDGLVEAIAEAAPVPVLPEASISQPAPPARVVPAGAEPGRPHVEAWPADQVVRFFGYGHDDTMVLSYADARRVLVELVDLLGAPTDAGWSA